MAVYTHIDTPQLRSALLPFGIGEVRAYTGIAEGVENTNYKIETDDGAFILTLIEKRTNPDDLPFFTAFMRHLREQNIPCPAALTNDAGNAVFSLAGKSAVLTTFLEGAWPRDISSAHCREMGKTLASMHLAAKDFSLKRANTMALPAWKSLVHACRARASEVEDALFPFLDAELDYLEGNRPKFLPRSAVHADLFPDNVFFKDGRISGVIDFYFSCRETLAYDAMLTFNAWCFDKNKGMDIARAHAFFEGYQTHRAFSAAEIKSLPYFGRAAAMRIVATRLYDWLNPAQGAVVTPKDPMEHVRILRFHQTAAAKDYMP